MSTCPEKDLHSIYLDGEMPENFKREYEAHLAGCEKCRTEYLKLKRLSDILKADSLEKNDENRYLDESFERLQTKLRYAENTSHLKSSDSGDAHIISSPAKWIASAVAAAAVFAVIISPAAFKNKASPLQEIQAIARTQIKPIAENRLVIDGDIDTLKIANALSKKEISETEETENLTQDFSQNQKVIRATNVASFSDGFSDIDVFRPDFNNSPASVKIEIPHFYTIPNEQAGNFESHGKF